MGAFPTGRNAYYDPLLSNFAVALFDKQGGDFIADQIAPVVPVPKQSGLYRIFDPESWLRVHDDLRAPRTTPGRVTFTTSSGTFFAKNRALSADIALEDLAQADTALQLRENHAQLITLTLKRAQEVRVAALATASGGPATIIQCSGATAWDAVTSADVLGQVNSAHVAIWNQSGMRPNTVIVDWESLLLLQRNERLLNMYRYTQGGELPADTIRDKVFKVSKMIVANAIQNTAGEGLTANNAAIWGNICLFCYTDPNARSDMSPNYLTRFRWPGEGTPYKSPTGDPLTMSVFRSVYDRAGEPKVEVLEAGYFQDEQVTGRALSYMLKTK